MDDGQRKPRLCPICEAEVKPTDLTCPSCSTDLTLFGMGGDKPAEPAPDVVIVGGGDKIDNILSNLGSEKKAAQPAQTFQCPDCGTSLPVTASSCSKCGLNFEGMVAECPMCQTRMDIRASKCASCGAEFASEESSPSGPEPAKEAPRPAAPAAPAQRPSTPSPTAANPLPAAAAPVPPPKEEPKPTAPPAEAMPQEPAKKPEAELTFIERMKMLKAQQQGASASGAAQPRPSAAPATGAQRPATSPQTGAAPAQRPPGPAFVPQRPPAQQPAAQKPATPPAAFTPRPPAAPQQKPSPAILQPVQGGPTMNQNAMRDLPSLVGIIKDDLALAKTLGIEVASSRDIINQAILAGRNKDLKGAVDLIKKGNDDLAAAFTTNLNSQLAEIQQQLSDLGSTGEGIAEINAALAKCKAAAAERKWADAFAAIGEARAKLQATAMDYLGAKRGLDGLKAVLEDGSALRLALTEIRSLYEDGMKAASRKDWDTAKMLVDQGKAEMVKILPGFIATEMRKAKARLLEVKMMNLDIAKPIGHLKEANAAVKAEDYGTALHNIRLFRESMPQDAP
ncbi:MAG: hypothetical protein HZB92_05905 [Euryarchaeota archaeon]|nr:hypothetical protein [Euryarchaeota archaeon]